MSYLSAIPNLCVMAPKNKWELSDMVKFALNLGHPAAIRYPRGEAYAGLKEFRAKIEYGKSEMLYEESGVALLAVGSMVKAAEGVRERLKAEGYPCTLVNARFAAPLDTGMLDRLAESHGLLVTMEENVRRGGFGEHVLRYLSERGGAKAEILTVAIPDAYVPQGSVDVLYRELGLDCASVTEKIKEALGRREREGKA